MRRGTDRWMRLPVWVTGAGYLAAGATLIGAPAWFFAHVGPFEMFNRHYMADLGSFLLPLGFGLLVAARDPAAHRSLIRVAAAGGLLHGLNHAYDAVADGAGVSRWLADVLPVLAAGAVLVWVYRRAGRRQA